MSDGEALAKMVYEAVRFANWAAGEGFFPAAGENAADPADFLSDFINGSEHLDGDDWDRLPQLAKSAVLDAYAFRETDKSLPGWAQCTSCACGLTTAGRCPVCLTTAVTSQTQNHEAT